MMLTAYVKNAGDHHFILGIKELPGVEAVATSVHTCSSTPISFARGSAARLASWHHT